MSFKRIVSKILFFCILISPGLECTGTGKSTCEQIIKELRVRMDTTIMDFGDYDVMLPPSMYCPGDEIRYIFAVPQDNMVGTNEIDNAIKLLEFSTDEELRSVTIKKDFMEMVTGPFEFRFLPVWSNKEIAYSQSKGFLLVDIKDKKVEIHTISSGMYAGDIENIAVLDGENRIFVLEILKSSGDQEGNIWDEKTLKIIRFDKGTYTLLAEHSAGNKMTAYTEPWFIYQKKIFIYKDKTTKLEVYDENFKPAIHPLAESFNRNQVGFRCMKEIALHPTLPFALIIEQGKWPTNNALNAADSLPTDAKRAARRVIFDEANRLTMYLFNWNEQDEKKRLIPLLSSVGSVWNNYNPVDNYSHMSFSPDGKWLIFRDGSLRGDDYNSSDNPVFVAVPINEKKTLYLGKPVKLGKVIREDATGPKGTAWTTKPTAFVMCDGMLIYRWNLDKYLQQGVTRIKMPPGSPDPFVK